MTDESNRPGDGSQWPAGVEANQVEWERMLERWGRAHVRVGVGLMRHLPSPPRCEVCGCPFGGVGGRFMRMLGKAPSRKNPRWCRGCFEDMPEGGSTLTVGVMFADVRGSTALAEGISPAELASILGEFYERVTKVIVRHGIVDKLVGDEVMGVYIPPFTRAGDFAAAMVEDAEEILRSIGYGDEAGPVLDVGIGLEVGPAFIGVVGRGEVNDFTVLGDVVNTAARLQARAASGEIVLSERAAAAARVADSAGRREALVLKGKSEAVPARVLRVA